MDFSAAKTAIKKSPGSEAGARLGSSCHGGHRDTNRTVLDPRSLHNSAISETRRLWHFEHGTAAPRKTHIGVTLAALSGIFRV